MERLNATWHLKHPMPRNASWEQRVKWHIGHAKACDCREVPKTILAEFKTRRISGAQSTARVPSPKLDLTKLRDSRLPAESSAAGADRRGIHGAVTRCS
jgi:hypothetical protein